MEHPLIFYCVFWVFSFIIDDHSCLKCLIFTKLSLNVYLNNMCIYRLQFIACILISLHFLVFISIYPNFQVWKGQILHYVINEQLLWGHSLGVISWTLISSLKNAYRKRKNWFFFNFLKNLSFFGRHLVCFDIRLAIFYLLGLSHRHFKIPEMKFYIKFVNLIIHKLNFKILGTSRYRKLNF